jgi:hypothetical protein
VACIPLKGGLPDSSNKVGCAKGSHKSCKLDTCVQSMQAKEARDASSDSLEASADHDGAHIWTAICEALQLLQPACIPPQAHAFLFTHSSHVAKAQLSSARHCFNELHCGNAGQLAAPREQQQHCINAIVNAA